MNTYKYPKSWFTCNKFKDLNNLSYNTTYKVLNIRTVKKKAVARGVGRYVYCYKNCK